MFEPDPEQGVRFIAAQAIDADAVRVAQTQVRRRILRAFVRRGRIDAQTRKEMEAWDHGGGFSLDASVRIEADDRKGLEGLLRYCARPPFAADRLEELDPQRLIHRLPKPGLDGRAQIILSPLELIGRIGCRRCSEGLPLGLLGHPAMSPWHPLSTRRRLRFVVHT